MKILIIYFIGVFLMPIVIRFVDKIDNSKPDKDFIFWGSIFWFIAIFAVPLVLYDKFVEPAISKTLNKCKDSLFKIYEKFKEL